MFAATLTVTTTNDSGSGSLRQAIANAQPGDTINFSLPKASTIMLTSGSLQISTNLTIIGPGAAQLAVSGNQIGTIFYIESGAVVTFSGLTIGPTDDSGIFNDNSTLTLNNCTVSGNTAYYDGGGIYNNGARSRLMRARFRAMRRRTSAAAVFTAAAPSR